MRLKISFALFFLIFFSACETATKNGTDSSKIKTVVVDSSSKVSLAENSSRVVSIQDFFTGEIRSDVKTSYVKTVADTFSTVKELHNWLKSDEYMHKNTEAKHNNTPRTAEENHNVYLHDVYIFGVKKEEDNDFHIVLGSSKSLDKEQLFFSAEISGLPDSSSEFYSTLSAVRTKFISHFGNDITKEYVFVASKNNPPILLDYIQGSLFFDNHHYGGHSSIKGRQVCSAWEIHPVTFIGFHSKP